LGILETTKARFANSGAPRIHCIRVVDPLHEVFLQATFNLIRSLSGNEADQINLRVRASGLYYRVTSFVSDDFASGEFRAFVENELEELITLSSQFEAVDIYRITIAKTLPMIIDRGANFKREAIRSYLSSKSACERIRLVDRGHKWRTVDLPFKPFYGVEVGTMSYEFDDFQPLDAALVPSSPLKLSKKLQKELYFGGGSETLVVFLYSKEKLKLPDIPVFVDSDEFLDSPLMPSHEVTEEKYFSSEHGTEESPGEELDIELNDFSPNSDRVLKLLLISNEEIYIRPWDYVWCDDQGHLTHLPATEMVEGMRLLLRAEQHVEKPEAYLDRSEEWRTPLRNAINLGVSCASMARNIEYRSGITVNSRMIRSWIDGNILGPEEKTVFVQLIEELKVHCYVDQSLDTDIVEFWWEDLEKARFSQTNKGVKNRAEALKEAERVLSDDKENNISSATIFEYSEILVIDKTWLGANQVESFGISNHRNMRVFS
jgi:hypothetical protein